MKNLLQIKNNQKVHAHSILTRMLLLTMAAFIFIFNTVAKVDVGAQDIKSAITTQNIIDYHNRTRINNSLGELTFNYLLSKSAQSKADAMIKANCWSHYCPNGESPWDFFNQANYNYVFAGENLAEGFYNIEDLMNAWMKSPTHRENILKKEYVEVGVGIAYGDFQGNQNNVLVVVHFGARNNNIALSADNQKIEIINPKSGDTIKENIADIKGNVHGFDVVNIIVNNSNLGTAQIDQGIFTYNLKNLTSGKNEIYASGSKNGIILNSNKIEIYSNSQLKATTLNTNLSQPEFNISPSNKNIINLVFALILAAFFLIDILVIKRSIALKANRSFSHYHFVIFIILGIIILVGGFSGNITNGLHL